MGCSDATIVVFYATCMFNFFSIPKPIQRTPTTTKRVDDVVGSDRPATGVLGVGDGVADDVGEEVGEDLAGLLVDQARQTLDPAATGETTDGGTGDALEVAAEDLAVALGSALAEAFAAFAHAELREHLLVLIWWWLPVGFYRFGMQVFSWSLHLIPIILIKIEL